MATFMLTLDAREVRVLGSLIEKELSTPDYYPMTLNSIATACNQKSNRDPVVDYEQSDIIDALDGLQRKRLVGNASSSHDRAAKYRHALAEVMDLKPPMLAVLSSLMLRGHETAGELRARTTRMHPFESLDEVDAVLGELSDRESPLVMQLPRRPGQKEARYAHLLAGEPVVNDDDPTTPGDRHTEERLGDLEQQIEALRDRLDVLTDAFQTFRRQFE
jgi:uncharacterized protein YceH (UPF0502 family)